MDLKEKFINLLKKKNYSYADVVQATELTKTDISRWLNHDYTGKDNRIIDVVNNFIEREEARVVEEEIPYIETSTVKYVHEISRVCHTSGKIGVCTGQPGLGKTYAIKKYTDKYLDSILIESDSSYSAKALLLDIHKRLNLSGTGTTYKLKCEVLNKLYNSGRFLIIDEADKLKYSALEMARRIHDKTGIGILLIGASELYLHMTEYKQLYSRVKYYKSLNKLSIQDVMKVLEAMHIDLSLASTYLKYSDGNMRTLSNLISHSLFIARINKKDRIDELVIEKSSLLLMV